MRKVLFGFALLTLAVSACGTGTDGAAAALPDDVETAVKEALSAETGVAVDFIRTYADWTHHGKEEDILFRDLAEKELSEEHQQVMDELVHEHVVARRTVGELVEAKERYVQGEAGALDTLLEKLDALASMYPPHITKEDERFFIPVMDYFSEAGRDAMLDEMWAFDREIIHEKYTSVVEGLEGRM